MRTNEKSFIFPPLLLLPPPRSHLISSSIIMRWYARARSSQDALDIIYLDEDDGDEADQVQDGMMNG